MKLVSIKFDGMGPNNWETSFLISLSSKNKCGFVDGTIVKPSSIDASYKAWNDIIVWWYHGF